jgi:hypothetical protein
MSFKENTRPGGECDLAQFEGSNCPDIRLEWLIELEKKPQPVYRVYVSRLELGTFRYVRYIVSFRLLDDDGYDCNGNNEA